MSSQAVYSCIVVCVSVCIVLVAKSLCVCAVHFPVYLLTLFPSDGLRGHLMSGMQPCAGDHLIGVTSGPKLARGI